MKKFILFLFSLIIATHALAQQAYNITGIVTGSDGQILPGATISITALQKSIVTDMNGKFQINVPAGKTKATVTFIGYDTTYYTFDPLKMQKVSIVMQQKQTGLKEVVISTGYQNLPRERATGSFSRVDSSLMQRRVSTDVLSRLEDNVPGLSFNRSSTAGGVNNPISIRGRSTLFANANPLIVLDNFPYEGDLSAINPNDVESVTVLKDAAAASIWGARAGNGVIVITTRKGKRNQAPTVSLTSNVTTGDKPDLYAQPRISSADYIELEKTLFAKQFYSSDEASANHPALSPVIELLIAQRDGKISAAQAQQQIEALKNQDVRKDYSRYLYRKSVNQQYALQLTGGSDNQSYHLSTGFDRNQSNLLRNDLSRVTVNAGNTVWLLNQRLSLSGDMLFSRQRSTNNNPGTFFWNGGQRLYPYASLADNNGNPATVTKDYRLSFLQGAENAGLLDWQYRPLEDLALANNTITAQNLRINTGLGYRIITGLNLQLRYLYEHNNTTGANLQSAGSYIARDQVNRYTSVNDDGTINRPLPSGGIYTGEYTNAETHYVRGQLDYSKQIGEKNELNVLAGYELRHIGTEGRLFRYYGYDEEHGTSQPVDYISNFPFYYNPSSSGRIPNPEKSNLLTDNFVSWFSNASWAYDGKYILSGSARFDRSNLFGVNTNQKGVPLWSAGLAWDITKESFYKVDWLPSLKLRATYGVSGNLERTLSAYTTATYYGGASQLTGLPFATIVNPPNPDLRWERIHMLNFGLDFSTKGNRLSGSIEYYRKKGTDIIGDAPYPASSGIITFRGNTAQTEGNGIDINLNGRIIENQHVTWLSTLLVSHATDKVTRFLLKSSASSYVQQNIPVEGKPLYGIYSYAWAGLDPKNGDPQGLLDGVISKNYSTILGNTPDEQVIYHGPARPTWFGAWRNTVRWKQITLSASVSYRFGYYFRMNSIIYGSDMGLSNGNGDYARRWLVPGDETKTNVPSAPQSRNNGRDLFYSYSSTLVEKGDHIRLQDARLSWQPGINFTRCWASHAEVFLYANNIGLIWKATKLNIDPDWAYQAPPFALSAGISLTLK
ncbi:SusC/RagA family TonB-linked outer membrane protein [Mucilaginibacter sp. ZT4R22]|uniref:SusC/RagA family TonB-linked outer membrane protein n=1 Tax=Mucilaginibacter pankratovii TaxID=2772110 RepID=A0ABR7WNM6_9SPHI|nr:SusC/RagA family TonB-linked outer membrane protein [Mucilaginibacter pankratovii]MBD1362974.1 SusC/RagA family TonB-linked outer membrane protein [Mucilaginibacter pankratovii]